MTNTYQVIASGSRDFPTIVCHRYRNGEHVRTVNHGGNAVDAHFQALADGYVNEGSETAAYRKAVEAMDREGC